MPTDLTLEHLCKSYPQTTGGLFPVLEDVCLHVEKGAFVTVLGGNGYGKSTLLRIISGMEQPTQGRILLNGQAVRQRLGRVGLVSQEVDLLPWRTTLDNVAFGLELRGMPQAKREHLALAYLRAFGLEKFSACYPRELSGGMRQKVAIARTLVTAPDIILMDEPFSALDYQTRTSLQCFLLQLWAKLRETIVFVTHDVEEAVFLSDYIVLLSPIPAHVVEIIPVPLARPRVRSAAATAALCRQVLEKYGSSSCVDNDEMCRALEILEAARHSEGESQPEPSMPQAEGSAACAVCTSSAPPHQRVQP